MKVLKIVQTGLLTLLGTVSVFMTVSIIFDLFGIREKEGNYVSFVVYANLVCGILYLFAAYSSWKTPKWSNYSLSFALTILIVAFVGLLLHINSGGIYETRTVKAMIFRTVFTIVMLSIGIFMSKKIPLS